MQMMRGKWDGFEREVRRMSDEELEDSLQQIGEAMAKHGGVAQSQLIMGQYQVLLEERRRRDGT